MINAVIMASGYSKRMGQNKLLLKYKGKTFIETLINTLSSLKFNKIVLVAKDERVLSIGKEKGIIVIENEKPYLGQSESLKLGVEYLKDGDYMFFTGDQPLLNNKVIEILIKESEKQKDCIIIPKVQGHRAHPTIFPKIYREDLLSIEGDTGGRAVIKKYPHKVKEVNMEEELPFIDIDTNEEYLNLIKGVFKNV
ncbi:molybdenum cofactor cytidylyltransferase [Clostridium hydrogeniformans]|uniref:molybdenum cofactor cytidylyltransferase n=1 Tax=Clostridium hydrogeniformans TaxID=349933 RepID=UPI000481EE47|nr:molybdenum cofactor cytidylyltransferase [Clostridium hydrogeniformans]